MNPTLMDTEIAQERRLVTEIPGPRSQGLLAKKTEAVSSGVGVGLPVFIGRPGRGWKPAHSGLPFGANAVRRRQSPPLGR